MKQILLPVLAILHLHTIHAQDLSGKAETRETAMYRNARTIETKLVHTLLKIKFDYKKAYAYGKVWLTLSPYFYDTDQALIDAKGMDIHEVAIVKNGRKAPLRYSYNGQVLKIQLDKKYTGGEKYMIYIDYTSKPDEYKINGVHAITQKGLYFINADGRDKNKPVQIWTHGETEATSVWCPTIDDPAQRSTQELYITVPQEYVTLSNGLQLNSIKNADGTRTDYWKLDLPNAPYLFFMAVGRYSIIKDQFDGKEVNYYVEQEYAPVAKKIFGATPDMMRYFSQITGVKYPWPKYSQVIVRDFLSGAMENTTATLHNQEAAQNARELIDGNKWENTIAHELFHHWFGDYVTAESWSNLSLSESFATYGEILWLEHKYGKNKADELFYNKMLGYLYGNNQQKELVRFYYNNREDLFDAVTYNKGACILHMLRTYVGDRAFFKSINKFLTAHSFTSAEVHQLRLAFEETTGKDLNWFFNQWFFNRGHPDLDISYEYNDSSRLVKVKVKQMQDSNNLFRLNCLIDIYNGAQKVGHAVELTKKEQVFIFDAAHKPDLVNFDSDKTLVCTRQEHKTLDEFIHQFKYCQTYIDKREAINACFNEQKNKKAIDLLKLGLTDTDTGIRFHTLMFLINLQNPDIKNAVEPQLTDVAKNDPDRTTKAAAVHLLGMMSKKDHIPMFRLLVQDPSYNVAGEALEALYKLDTATAAEVAIKLKKQDLKGKMREVVLGILMKFGTKDDFDFYADNFDQLPVSEHKFQVLNSFAEILNKTDNTVSFKKGIDIIVRFRDAIPEPYRQQTNSFINQVVLKNIAEHKSSASAGNANTEMNEQVEYVREKINGIKSPNNK